ncbi:MAG TPA: TonB-dependent receptor [Anaeromyxobacter sp.]|nr:TonB-dependent receptor [Anaeromyxobacter sp.]
MLALVAFAAAARVRAQEPADAPPAPAPPSSELPPPPENEPPPPGTVVPDDTVAPDEVVVKVRPLAESARAPGAAVTTVDAAEFAGEAKRTATLLATSPGVAVSEHGGPGQLALVSIRGSSADQVKVLVDGLQLNGAAGGGVDLSTIPAPWIARIEVVRGTEGVHHGSGALGGVVNVVTLPVRPGTWGASATAGSFGTWEGAAHAAAGGEAWGLLGHVTGSTTDGDFPFENTFRNDRRETRRHAGAMQGGGLAKGYWVSEEARLDAALQLAAGRRDLPGNLQTGTTWNDWQEEARGLLAVKYRRRLGERLTFTAGPWFRAERLAVRLEEVEDGNAVDQRALAGGASVGLAWAGNGWTVAASGEAGAEGLTADGIGGRARTTLAATLAGEVALLGGRARVGPGVRLERTGAYDGISAKLGLSSQLAGPVSVRASFGRTYRIPSFAELHLQQGAIAPNPNLRPETGLGGDAGLVVEGRHGSFTVGGFAVLYDDLVVYDRASFRVFTPQNLARSAARGMELEGASSPMRGFGDLSAAVSYTWLMTENLRGGPNEVGNVLPHRPEHRLLARVTGRAGPVRLHADGQWVSRRWLDLANEQPIPGAFTLDAGGSVRLSRAPDVHLSLEVRNAFDVRNRQDGFMNPLPGRTVLFTVRAGSSEGSSRP